MLTVQEIQAMSFEKAVFGGYDMKSVDEFVEQITEDYAGLQKENAALKSKMKVLVDKIEEYRSVEDGMRRALVSAQSIAQETIDKAKLESEQLLATGKSEHEKLLQQFRTERQAEMRFLEDAKQKSRDFIAQMTAFYEEQLKVLVDASAAEALQAGSVPEMPAAAPMTAAPAAAPATKEELSDTRDLTKGETKKASEKEYTIPEDIRKFMDSQQKPGEGMKVQLVEVTLNDDSNAKAEPEPEKPKSKFGELKFGAGYSPENDR